jgi:hypothetical protein
MKTGNMNIKEAAKYTSKIRKSISSMVLKEYKELKRQGRDPIGSDFATHMLQVLTKAGYTAPDGTPLNPRGVRYQVLRTGIRFQGGRMEMAKGMEAPVETPKAVEPVVEEKQEILQSLSKIPELLERILMDNEVTPTQRVSLVKAWFEVEK